MSEEKEISKQEADEAVRMSDEMLNALIKVCAGKPMHLCMGALVMASLKFTVTLDKIYEFETLSHGFIHAYTVSAKKLIEQIKREQV